MSVAIIGIGVSVVGLAATGYGMVQQNKAAKKAAAVDVQTANYNAQVDTAQAEQIQLDTEANTLLAEKQGQQYLSRQAVSYAAAGVLGDTGTPLQAQIATAGSISQNINQAYSDSQRKQELLYAQAQEGVYYGQAQASADSARGTAALLTGGASIAGQAFRAYQSGTFSFGGGGGGGEAIDTMAGG